jgi:hypothetical protein
MADDDRRKALRKAAMTPRVFGEFYKGYEDARLPSEDMLAKILVSDYEVPEGNSRDCAQMISANGWFVGFIQNISKSPHVVLSDDQNDDTDEDGAGEETGSETGIDQVDVTEGDEHEVDPSNVSRALTNPLAQHLSVSKTRWPNRGEFPVGLPHWP